MAKLGYIYNSYGKQFNIAIANTFSYNVLNGGNLPKNSLIISSPYDDEVGDLGLYSLIATDYEGNAVRLSYCISEGNGLVYDNENDCISLNIDEKSIIDTKDGLKFDITYFIDNNTIKIEDDKICVNTYALPIASNTSFGVAKIDDDTIKTSNGKIYVNTTALDSADNGSYVYGIGRGDEKTIDTNYGKFRAVTENLGKANGETKGIAKADNFTTYIEDSKLKVDISKLERGISNKYGIVKGDEETIKIQNEMLTAITENLQKSSESNFGISKIDGKSIKLNSEGAIYMDSYDTLINKIDEYRELKQNYDAKINDIREEIKNSPYQFNRKDIYLFSVNKTSMTELNKPKHMEEVINMPEQYVIAEFNIITGCDFYISVNYDRFTNEFPPVTLVNINYNDEVEYKNGEGLGITTVYPSTEGLEKKLILTFWAKNFNNSARDKSLITSLEVTVSSVEDVGEKKTEKYSVVRYNSNYELPPEEKEKEEQETYIILTDKGNSWITDEFGNSYGLEDVIPWFVNNVILHITGRNSKTSEVKVLVDDQSYSLYDYRNNAWQGIAHEDTFYNDIPILISTPTTINNRLSIITQEIRIRKEVWPPNMTFQLTNKNLPINLYSYNVGYIKVKERKNDGDNQNISSGIIQDKITDYRTNPPVLLPTANGIEIINNNTLYPKLESTGYYVIPLTYTGTTYVQNTSFMIAHTTHANSTTAPHGLEDHDELLDSYFYNVSLNSLTLNIESADVTTDQTYGTSISRINSYIRAKYNLNGTGDTYINTTTAPDFVPKIYYNINGTYTSNVRYVSYIAGPPAGYKIELEENERLAYLEEFNNTYTGNNIVEIAPASTIYLDSRYLASETPWSLSYSGVAYFAYYGGTSYDLESPDLAAPFNININIVSEPYLTVSNLIMNTVGSLSSEITNIGVYKEDSNINIIQTYQINGMNADTNFVTDGEFMIAYKYYIKGSPIDEPTIKLTKTELINDEYKYIYQIVPPAEYYESNTITTDQYYISYSIYNYASNSDEFGWKETLIKEWHKYEILNGAQKILTDVILDKGEVLEAYFVVNNIEKPSSHVFSYAYSIINDNLFDEDQIYSINTDANNYLYLLSNINEYYLPSNAQNLLNTNNNIKIKIENINNIDDAKSLTIDGYLSVDPEVDSIYNITRNSTDVDAKYKLKIINQSKPTAVHATLSNIYNNPNDFNITNHYINKELLFDFELDYNKSTNFFYLFLENADKIYTTLKPLTYFKAKYTDTTQRKSHIESEYMANNELWHTLKAMVVTPRTIAATCKKNTTNVTGTTTVNIPYLDELGLWDEFFCPTVVTNGTGLTFNTSLIAVKVEKYNSTSSNKYVLTTNRNDIETTVRNAVIAHVGKATGNNESLITSSIISGKKSTWDYCVSDLPYDGAAPIYSDEECSIADAYINQWKMIFVELGELVVDGQIQMPDPPGEGATQQEIDEYNNKLHRIEELEKILQDLYANDDQIDALFNQTNIDTSNYYFSQIDNNLGYDVSLYKKNDGGPEYKFKYLHINTDTEEEEQLTGEIDIDNFVQIAQNFSTENYQKSILDNLFGDTQYGIIEACNYFDGYRTFELYANMLLRGYDLFDSSSYKTTYPNNYYLHFKTEPGAVLPADQDEEFSIVTRKNKTEYPNFGDWANAFTSNSHDIENLNTIYYSLTSVVDDLSLPLYKDSEQIFSPAYHYFTLKDKIINWNVNFITGTLGCDIIYNNSNPYNYQFASGSTDSIRYDTLMFQLNIDDQILNNFKGINYHNYYVTDGVESSGYSNEFKIAKPKSNSKYAELVKAAYDFKKYQDDFIDYIQSQPGWQNDGSLQTKKTNLLTGLNTLNAERAADKASYENHENGDFPKNVTIANDGTVTLTNYGTWTWIIPSDPNQTPTCNLSWADINGKYDQLANRIQGEIDNVNAEIIRISHENATLSEDYLNRLQEYNEKKTIYDDAYNTFTAQLNTYNSVKVQIASEVDSFYYKLEHDKNIILNKKIILSAEYDRLLKAYIKKQILTFFKTSKSYAEGVSFYNMNNQTTISVISGMQNNIIESYVQGAMKEVDYVLNIIQNDIKNIKNSTVKIYDGTINIEQEIAGGETDILNLFNIYNTNFEIFNNIVPRYKIFNKYNIMYLDNIYDEDGDNQYFIKYSIDNDPNPKTSFTQLDLNMHNVFFGTLKYSQTEGQYIHLYEYYNNYFVKEIMAPLALLDIASISNGFKIEMNTDNSNNKFFKTKYNEDSVLANMIVSGYPEIVYRKNKVSAEYDNYEILYTTSNNITIENNLTLLSLQKNYMLFDNLGLQQYVCGNREYYIVDLAEMSLIPYYGNMMFVSNRDITKTNPKYVFANDGINYKIIDYNLYFVSSNLRKDKVNLNSTGPGTWFNHPTNTGSYIGLFNFEDSLKIFSYIKDYYNETGEMPDGRLGSFCNNGFYAYTNNLIWKYCKNKQGSLAYFKLLNYQWIMPGISGNNNVDVGEPEPNEPIVDPNPGGSNGEPDNG